MQFVMDGPSIHHIFFADNNFFMYKASTAQATVLNRILQYYGEATGENINLQK